MGQGAEHPLIVAGHLGRLYPYQAFLEPGKSFAGELGLSQPTWVAQSHLSDGLTKISCPVYFGPFPAEHEPCADMVRQSNHLVPI